MRAKREEGYILASALAVLLAISLVAAALVSTSADGLRRVRSAEADAAKVAVLRSAILLTSSQLALDPRRRQLQFEGETAQVEVLGKAVQIRVAWEHLKLDVNRASLETIEQRLSDAGISAPDRIAIQSKVEEARSKQSSITLLDDLVRSSQKRECLHSILTVFGGRPDYDRDEGVARAPVGQSTAGSRVLVETSLTHDESHGLAAVMLMTGNLAEPARVLDLRVARSVGEKRCDDI